jgi:hypothetical protein
VPATPVLCASRTRPWAKRCGNTSHRYGESLLQVSQRPARGGACINTSSRAVLVWSECSGCACACERGVSEWGQAMEPEGCTHARTRIDAHTFEKGVRMCSGCWSALYERDMRTWLRLYVCAARCN